MRPPAVLPLLALSFLLFATAPALAVDTDGDGLDDSVEAVLGTNPGLADSDFDDIDDFVETDGGSAIDTDNDGVIDALDEDSDGDGYSDLLEAVFDSDADGTPDYRDTDSDDDGIPDVDELDQDADFDGSSNRIDPDDDGDGYPTIVEGDFDSDGDGTPDYLDLDSDDDDIADAQEFDQDFDSDGLPDRIDPDDDGDGYSTLVEGTFDADGDGNLDYLDLDSDDDGIADADELDEDTDFDGSSNRIDPDDDGDGYSTFVEGDFDSDGDGTPDYLDLDSDDDGVADPQEFDGDFDADGLPNRIDPDDDGDGIATLVEGTDDVDGDGNLNYLDLDSDGDGLGDAGEGLGDPDADGIPNYLDFDSDDDGFSDLEESGAGSDPYDAASTPENVDAPVLVSVTDVGNDQGRRLRLNWTRSRLDVVGSTEPVLSYAIYRRIDANKVSEEDDGSLLKTPAGNWDFVRSAPAVADPQYFLLVDSLCDSTDVGVCWSVYFVRAITSQPGVYFDSPPDSGYSIDNLAPSAPTGVAVAYGAQNELSWQPSDAEDFRYFKVYRGDVPDFVPEDGTLVQTTTDTGWIDSSGDRGANYLVSAVDFSGNEGPAAAPATVTGADDVPRLRAGLEQNVPNPFNPRTTIGFRIPTAGSVSLRVYDTAGRLVRVLVDGSEFAAGRHEVVWDGSDGSGARVAGGVYLYTVKGPGIERTRRMVMVK